MRSFAKVLVALSLTMLAACNQNAADLAADRKSSAEAPTDARAGSAGDGGAVSGAVSDATTVKPDPMRVIIYTSAVSLYVDSLVETEKKLPAVLEQFGAYVSESEVTRYNGNSRQGKWVVRVPVAQYKAMLVAIGGLGAVESSTSKADDVTAEFVDVEARLKNKRAVEERLQGILKQQTGKISDVLEVEREIARVREEIERAEGRIRFLKNQATLSTVTLQVYERYAYEAMPSDPSLADRIKWGWRESTHDLIAFCKATIVFAVRTVPWLPFWIALFFVGRFLVRKFRTRKIKAST